MEPQPSENTAAASDAPPVKPCRRRSLLWVFLVLLILYPLSSGPVTKLWSMAGFSDDVVLGLYTPLIYLAFYSQGFRQVFTWYLSLWKTSLGT